MEKEKIWKLEGHYMESCNCDVVCPCLINSIGNNLVPATYTHCDLLLGFSIDKGHYKDIDLSGLCFAYAIYSPGYLMDCKNWTIAAYITDKANDEQYKALDEILSGKIGGGPEILYATVEEVKPTKKCGVNVVFSENDRCITTVIDDIAKCKVTAIPGVHDDEVVELTNCHGLTKNGRCVQGVTGLMTYNDHGFSFNNTGRSGLYAEYVWADTSVKGDRG